MNLASETTKINPQASIDFLTRFREEYKTLITPYRATEMTCEFMKAYGKLHDYVTAKLYCNKLIADIEKRPRQLFYYVALGRFLVESGQCHAAEKYLIDAERIAKEERRISYLQSIYLIWNKADSAKGNLGAALEKFKLYKAYTDSTMNDSKAKEIALLEVEYETAKKEQSIALLTKDSELARQQLAQSRFRQNGILTGLAVAVLISGLLFNQYRIKKKAIPSSHASSRRYKARTRCSKKRSSKKNGC